MIYQSEWYILFTSASHLESFFYAVPSMCYNNFKFTKYFRIYYLIYFWQLISGAYTRNVVCCALKLRQKLLREFQL